MNTPDFSQFFRGWLLPVLLLFWGSTLFAQGDFKAPGPETRIFTCGNSYTNSTFNTGLEALAEQAGHEVTAMNTAGVAGARLMGVWKADQDSLQNELKGQYYDILTLQSYQTNLEGEIQAAKDIMKLAREGNPEIRVILFTIWPGYSDRYDPPEDRSQSWNEQIQDALQKEFPDNIIQVMPVSILYQELYEMIDAGRVPNIDSYQLLFRDGGHPGKYGAYPINAMAASMIWNENPVGYPSISVEGQSIEEETAKVLQQLTWDVLQTYGPAQMNPELTITTRRLDPVAEGLAYEKQLEAINLQGEAKWSLSEDSEPLPDGLEITADGKITGKTGAVGEHPVTVKLVDDQGTDTRAYTLKVEADEPPKITMESIPTIEHAQYFSETLQAEDGIGLLSWELVEGELPAGMTLLPSGFLMGAPGESGEFEVTLKVTDSHPVEPKSDSKAFTIKVSEPAPETLVVRKYQAPVSPVMDGEFDEPYWNFGDPLNIEKTVEGSPTATVKWDAFWWQPDAKGRPLLVIGAKIDAGDLGLTEEDAIDIFFDGNNNDEVIYNYDDAHWRFTREEQRAGDRVEAGYMRFFSADYGVTETEDGWQLEVSFNTGALRGRGIVTAFPDYAVYGFDIAVRQGTEGDIHTKVWQGSEKNPEDTSPFGTMVWAGETSEPAPVRQLVNADFTDNQIYAQGIIAVDDLPKHAWVTSRSSGTLQGWSIQEGVGAVQRDPEGNEGESGAGLMQIIDSPGPGKYTLSFEHRTPEHGLQVGVWGASPEGGKFNANDISAPENLAQDATQFLEPQQVAPAGDDQWHQVSFPVNVSAETRLLAVAFKGDVDKNVDTAIRNVRLRPLKAE